MARLSKQKKENHRAKFLIPFEKEDYEKIVEDQGFVITYNPPENGIRQFAGLAHQLSGLGIFRDEKVEYLESNPLDHDGFPLLEPVPEYETWGDYLLHMMQNQTFGDQLTLYAAANLYNVNAHVISSLGVGTDHTFSPSSSIPLTTVHLGHFAENHGEHYVSLTPGTQNSVSGCNDFMEDEDGGGDAINDDDRSNVADVTDDVVQDVSRDSDDVIAGGIHSTDDSQDQQFLNNDVLEIIIKLTLRAFPFMRENLKDVNRFFRSMVDKVPCPRVYIPELPDHPMAISVRKIIMLKGRGNGPVVRLEQIIRSPK